ncbi:MAG: hypothetical protein ABSF15_26640 [Candidatus Sulfotelmatobacter sp.]|jgi:hypothetical protein
MCDHHGLKTYVQVRTLDMNAARRYLHSVESLCKEAQTSADPRVLLTALRVLRLAVAQMSEI